MEEIKRKPNLCWVTSDYMVDSDLKLDFIRIINRSFSIHWIIVFPNRGQRYSEIEFYKIQSELEDIRIDFFYEKFRHRDPRLLGDYCRLRTLILSDCPDVIYLNHSVGEPFTTPFYLQMPRDKTIIAAHQGTVHSGMKRKLITSVFRHLVYGHIKNVNMFSASQKQLFENHYKRSTVFLNRMGLKEFGVPRISRDLRSDKVHFLSFGIINSAKNIELLIDAAESLYESGENRFRVSICGACEQWRFYENRIRHHELFETDIRRIPNESIPDLFTKAHFLVQPYRAVSQSGPLKIAYSYNTPVIVSDLPGFVDEVEDGISGFIFKSDNVDSLKHAMKRAIDCYFDDYSSLLLSQADFVRSNYSTQSLAQSYVEMFFSVMNYVG